MKTAVKTLRYKWPSYTARCLFNRSGVVMRKAILTEVVKVFMIYKITYDLVATCTCSHWYMCNHIIYMLSNRSVAHSQRCNRLVGTSPGASAWAIQAVPPS